MARRRTLLIALLVLAIAGLAGAFYGGLLEIAPTCRLQITVISTNPPTVDALVPMSAGQCPHISASIINDGATDTVFDWGDGKTTAVRGAEGPGIGATHIYAGIGSYTVTATVKSAKGVLLDTLKATASTIIPLDISWTHAVSDKTVTFTASAIGGTPPYNYNWDYGDGKFENVATAQVTHTYAAYGTYQVKLQVTDSSTPSYQTKALGMPVEIKAGASPQVTFAWAANGWVVTFNADATGGTAPYTFTWNFGDGKTDTGNPVTHTYGGDGTYTATVGAKDANAMESSAQAAVTVAKGPDGCTANCAPPPPPSSFPSLPAPAIPFIGIALLVAGAGLVALGIRRRKLVRYAIPIGGVIAVLGVVNLLGLVAF